MMVLSDLAPCAKYHGKADLPMLIAMASLHTPVNQVSAFPLHCFQHNSREFNNYVSL